MAGEDAEVVMCFGRAHGARYSGHAHEPIAHYHGRSVRHAHDPLR